MMKPPFGAAFFLRKAWLMIILCESTENVRRLQAKNYIKR
jgi:hypothetical protein